MRVVLFQGTALFHLIGKFAYKIKKPFGRDVYCGVRIRCCDAAAAGAGFASETLFYSVKQSVSADDADRIKR